ncbi:MAG: regulatory protein [Mycobacterium sp.]|nr:regulatory protein [Mycobacterium sp.]
MILGTAGKHPVTVSCYRVTPERALGRGEHITGQQHLQLDPVPRVVGVARRFVADNAPDLPGPVHDVLLLLTSELVTNAVIHARTRLEVGITVTDVSVLVTVHDEDLGLSELPGPAREGGRGLELVSALSQDSALDRHPGDGKTAWFRLARSGSFSAEGR